MAQGIGQGERPVDQAARVAAEDGDDLALGDDLERLGSEPLAMHREADEAVVARAVRQQLVFLPHQFLAELPRGISRRRTAGIVKEIDPLRAGRKGEEAREQGEDAGFHRQ